MPAVRNFGLLTVPLLISPPPDTFEPLRDGRAVTLPMP